MRVTSEDDTASGSFEVQEYRKPEFEVDVSIPTTVHPAGQANDGNHPREVLLRATGRSGQVNYVIYRSGYYSPFRYVDTPGDEPGPTVTTPATRCSRAPQRSMPGAEATVPIEVPTDDDGDDLTLKVEARVTDRSEREVSGTAT